MKEKCQPVTSVHTIHGELHHLVILNCLLPHPDCVHVRSPQLLQLNNLMPIHVLCPTSDKKPHLHIPAAHYRDQHIAQKH